MFVFVRHRIILLLSVVIAISGCTTQISYSQEELNEIERHNDLLGNAEQFVHANLYTGMIHVRATNLRDWNQLLITYSCTAESEHKQLDKSYQNNHPVFSDAMKILAERENLFMLESEQAVLTDISQLAYRLFSISYAKGYARQIELADQVSPGIRDELCDGNIGDVDPNFLGYRNTVVWHSFETPLLQNNNGLVAHAENGDRAFQILLEQQYLQFDALVYSHAYQRTDAYQTLFFEVNKFENVQQYGDQVSQMSSLLAGTEQHNKHNDFAYLVLSSGYHWGMMSILALLEEEYPRVHELKKQQATQLIESTLTELDKNV
ncbi:hypothetical protein [Aliiglaciecola lipolytica]|uniref:Lipoprotein n=1 Tax=Aliiglaciecola lipolytica E3 TaxID=1127673 RepID=K6Y497_9ALTE|nr:hypothetical protein [Aliiglaciecola lipolytica]GAC13087.1 hypothetical protein GLIP_0440 [Aliiglaciecola lipolytica E3]